jgi:hypothetical protein
MGLIMTECICGNEEGTNEECERCELLRMGGVLSRLAMRLADRLTELGESPLMTAEEAGALVRCPADEMEDHLLSEGVEPVNAD